MRHEIESSYGSLAFCSCGQGFSGSRVAERLEEHVKSPDSDSYGALLMGVMSEGGW